MREKYHTEGFILRVSEFKEANKIYHIFSEKFGFIIATAQGVRLSKSKLKFGLQEYSLANLSVVRTGDVWKITNSIPHRNYYFDFKYDKEKLAVVSRINAFLQRFILGEEEIPDLYADLKDFFLEVETDVIDIRILETVFLLRFMNRLGVLKGQERFIDILNASNLKSASSFIKTSGKDERDALSESLRESQI